tara:strand:- start:1450 stop:2973 length:1524 start_codon:yes stop_codon:yes gene_type:complete
MANQDRRSPFEAPQLYSYGNNTSNSRTIWTERKAYDQVVFPDFLIKNVFETWNEERFYGTVNTKGNAVIPDTNSMKSLYYAGEQTHMALNFVADAWRDFAMQVQKLVDSNIIYSDSPWANMEVMKAWVPVSLSYNTYMQGSVYPVFRDIYMEALGRDRTVQGMESFLDNFDEYMDTILIQAGPITQSGFIEGSYMSPMISGLMIEVADAAYDDDFAKSYQFLDANFELIAEIAEQYGFSIDKNTPWRIIADLRNEAMQEYMYGVPIEEFDTSMPPQPCDPELLDPEDPPMAFGFSQIPGLEDVYRHIAVHFDEDGIPQPGYQEYQEVKDAKSQQEVFDILFSIAYNETWHNDIDLVQEHLLKFYNSYVDTQPTTTIKPTYNRRLECIQPAQTIERSPLTPEDFDVIYGDRWKLKTFYIARASERDLKKPLRLKKREIQQSMNIYNLSAQNRYQRALRHMQEEFIGPADTEPLTLDTVGDILQAQNRSENNDLSDTRRQERMRRDLYR